MNIYVGNLNYNTNEDDLKEVFEAHGKVESAKIITDKYSGRSKGFGFVEMPDEDEAKQAIDKLDGSEVFGRNIKVNQARERKDNFVASEMFLLAIVDDKNTAGKILRDAGVTKGVLEQSINDVCGTEKVQDASAENKRQAPFPA